MVVNDEKISLGELIDQFVVAAVTMAYRLARELGVMRNRLYKETNRDTDPYLTIDVLNGLDRNQMNPNDWIVSLRAI